MITLNTIQYSRKVTVNSVRQINTEDIATKFVDY